MKSVKEDIKNRQFKRVYLFLGEEGYLRNQYKNTLKKAIVSDDSTLNLSEYSGNGIDSREIIDTAETAPFLGEYRVIVISDSDLFKTSQDDLADYLKNVPDSTVIIFSQEEVDRKRKLFKAIKDNGRVIECGKQDETILTKWILSKIKAENKEITGSALRLFLNRVGDDMESISSELEKLMCYTMNKSSITEADVKDVCSENATDKVFEMIDFMSTGEQKKALMLYYDLITLKTPALKIMTLIARQYNILFQVKSLREAGTDKRNIATAVKISPYFVDKYISISNRYSLRTLKEAMELCADYDAAFKTGKINDTMAVEMLIVQFSSKVQR